jgi:hypothetical protein
MHFSKVLAEFIVNDGKDFLQFKIIIRATKELVGVSKNI